MDLALPVAAEAGLAEVAKGSLPTRINSCFSRSPDHSVSSAVK